MLKVKNLKDCFNKIKEENDILKKLLYRNKNQHRKTKIFHCIKEVTTSSFFLNFSRFLHEFSFSFSIFFF